MREAEVALALLLEGALESDVEVVAGIVAESEEHLDDCSVVTHLESYWEVARGDSGAVCRDRKATAGACGLGVVYVAARCWIEHVEVCRSQHWQGQRGNDC